MLRTLQQAKREVPIVTCLYNLTYIQITLNRLGGSPHGLGTKVVVQNLKVLTFILIDAVSPT